MDYLLDTHVLLWNTFQVRDLSSEARRIVRNPDNILWFSVASLWEISIKRSLGKPDFQADPRILRSELLRTGFRELVITAEHAMAVSALPSLHGDPFDRLLLAQHAYEGYTFVTADRQLWQYPGKIQRV